MSPMEREIAILDRVRANLEAEGFEVLLEPDQFSLPEFLQNVRPDAVAQKGDEHLIVEVVSRSQRTEDRLQTLRTAIAGHPGWSLRVVWTSGSTVPRSPATSTPKKVKQSLAEVDQLLENGFTRPAFLLTWAAMEAAGRIVLPSELNKPQTPRRLIEHLASHGSINRVEASFLRAFADMRNSLIHGDLDLNPSRQDVVTLRVIVDKIL